MQPRRPTTPAPAQPLQGQTPGALPPVTAIHNSSPSPKVKTVYHNVSNKKDHEKNEQTSRDTTEFLVARNAPRRSTNPHADKEASKWKRADQYGNPLVENQGNLSSGDVVYDMRVAGFYIHSDSKALVEIDGEKNIQIDNAEKLNLTPEKQFEIICDIVALNRSEPTVEIKSPTGDQYKRLERILRIDVGARNQFRKNMEKKIEIARQKGLAIHLDNNYKDLLKLASHGFTSEQTITIQDGTTSTVLPWHVGIQRQADELLQKQMKDPDGFWKQFIDERNQYQTHLIKEYSDILDKVALEYNSAQGQFTVADLVLDTNVTLGTGTNTITTTARAFLVEQLDLLAALQSSMENQCSQMPPKPEQSDIDFIERTYAKNEAELKKFIENKNNPPSDSLHTKLETAKSNLTQNIAALEAANNPANATQIQTEKDQLKKLTEVSDKIHALVEGQKRLKQTVENKKEAITAKREEGTSNRAAKI